MPRGREVAVPHKFTRVEAYYCAFEGHGRRARALYARRLFTGWRWSKPLVTLLLRGDARVAHKCSAEMPRSQALSGVRRYRYKSRRGLCGVERL